LKDLKGGNKSRTSSFSGSQKTVPAEERRYVVFTIIYKSPNVGGDLMKKSIDKKKKGYWGRRAPFYLIKNFN